MLVTFLSIARPTSSSVGSRSVPWLGKCLSMNYQITVYCAALCQIVSLHYLYRASLQRLASLPCRLFLSSGLQVMTREVHRLSFRRSAPLHFSDIAGYGYDLCPLPDKDVGPSVIDAEHTSSRFDLCRRKFFPCLPECPCEQIVGYGVPLPLVPYSSVGPNFLTLCAHATYCYRTVHV